MTASRLGPWLAIAGLLGLCLFQGLRMTAGLALPPDLDALRDIGFAQGLSDGNWFGDPAYAGAIRYYPPLVPALGAFAAWLTSTADLPALWVEVGPWAGLLPVAMFFGLARRLFASDAAAACGTAAFVLVNSAASVPWIGGGYTPWLLTPLFAQAAFCATAWLIHARVGAARWRDGVFIGLAIGATFLAHAVPAMVLTAMLVAAVLAMHAQRWRSVAWLALVAAFQLAAMAPYLLPLLIAYPHGIVHAAPGAWTDGALAANPADIAALALCDAPMPLAMLAAWRWRAQLSRLTVAMLGSWLGLCVAALARHYACAGSNLGPAACRILRVPAHHFHLYLQVGGACLIGWAVHAVWRNHPHAREALSVLGLLALIGGAASFLARDYDLAIRDVARHQADEYAMDLAAYAWIRAATAPQAVFAQATPADADAVFDSGAFAIMAAGRRLVAAPLLFSNPYLAWEGREAMRRRVIAWLDGDPTPIPCANFTDGLWAVLPADTAANRAIDAARAAEVFRSAAHRIVAVRPAGCSE